MNNFNDQHRIIASPSWPLSNISTGSSQSKVVLAACAIVMLIGGGFFLVNYPLETVIVMLFVGSILSMSRG